MCVLGPIVPDRSARLSWPSPRAGAPKTRSCTQPAFSEERSTVDRPNASTAAPDAKTVEALWQIVGSKFVVKSLYAAAELRVADALLSGPLPVEELARRTNAHAPSLYRILRALASVGVFTETSAGTFANTPMSELIVDTPHSIRPMVLWIHDPRHDHAW